MIKDKYTYSVEKLTLDVNHKLVTFIENLSKEFPTKNKWENAYSSINEMIFDRIDLLEAERKYPFVRTWVNATIRRMENDIKQ